MKRTCFLSLLLLAITGIASAQNTFPWNQTSYIGIQTAASPLAPLHVKTNVGTYGVLALQDHSGSGSSGQAIMSFLGANGNRLACLGPSWGQFLLQNDQFGVVTVSPNGVTLLGGYTNLGNTLQVHGTAYVQTNLGVGTSTPNAQLEAKGTILSSSWNNDAGVYITGENGNYGSIQATNGDNSDYKNLVLQEYDGSVAIGTNDPKGYKLAVNGDAIFTKVKVRLYNQWPDYVFTRTYRLPTLKEVEDFIRAHKHLPDVPSASQVEMEGLDVGENQAVLLKKIEELTLYLIELKKQVDDQQREMESLKKGRVANK